MESLFFWQFQAAIIPTFHHSYIGLLWYMLVNIILVQVIIKNQEGLWKILSEDQDQINDLTSDISESLFLKIMLQLILRDFVIAVILKIGSNSFIP